MKALARVVLGGCLAAQVACSPWSYQPQALVKAVRESADIPEKTGVLQPGDLTLRHARIWDGVHPGIQRDLRVRMEAGVVKEVAPDPGTPLGPGERDLAQQFVMPGLCDAHVHLSLNPGAALRNDDAATTARLRAQHLRAYLAYGVTTLMDPAVDERVGAHLHDAMAKGAVGPRYFHLGPVIPAQGGYMEDLFGPAVTTLDEARPRLRHLPEIGAIGAKFVNVVKSYLENPTRLLS